MPNSATERPEEASSSMRRSAGTPTASRAVGETLTLPVSIRRTTSAGSEAFTRLWMRSGCSPE